MKIASQEIKQRYSDYDKYKPYKADFADGNRMVSGTLPAGIKGGNPYVIIRDRDKKILDVNRSNSMKIRCIRNSHINRWIV